MRKPDLAFCGLGDISMISIIVPVYNAYPYLRKCVDSIIAQTVQEWELLLVDDGSTDGSSELCDLLVQKDNRIRVIHKDNGGASSARNAGLDIASGTYIMFVDSDDWIAPDLCKKLLEEMNSIEECDLVIGGYIIVEKDGFHDNGVLHAVINMNENLSSYFEFAYMTDRFSGPVVKLYRRKLIGGQRFDTSVRLGEDFQFNMRYLMKCSKILMSDTVGYYYNKLNYQSITHQFRRSKFRDNLKSYELVKKFLYHFHIEEHLPLVDSVLCTDGIYSIKMALDSNYYSRNERKRIVLQIINNVQFQRVCAAAKNLSLQYRIPCWLCRKKSYIGLRLLFLLGVPAKKSYHILRSLKRKYL